MRNKLIKSLIVVFILMICSVLFITGTKYIIEVSSIKSFGVIKGMSNVISSGYNELKSSIDQKYTEQFVKLLNETSTELKNGISSVLGDEYVLLSGEFDEISDNIANEKKAFENNEEYLSLKNKLSTLKGKIDALDKSSKEEYINEFKTTLSEISTLNTKFNNQLKSKRERIDEIVKRVKELFLKNKDELISLRDNQIKITREKLKELFMSYNVEIKELNDAFSVKPDKAQMPFDVNTMQNLMVAGKLETECFSEILSESGARAVVFSENNVNLKS